MPEYKLISADSHVSEPPDLWATRVDKKYRERAPQLMVNPPGKEGALPLRGLSSRSGSASASVAGRTPQSWEL